MEALSPAASSCSLLPELLGPTRSSPVFLNLNRTRRPDSSSSAVAAATSSSSSSSSPPSSFPRGAPILKPPPPLLYFSLSPRRPSLLLALSSGADAGAGSDADSPDFSDLSSLPPVDFQVIPFSSILLIIVNCKSLAHNLNLNLTGRWNRFPLPIWHQLRTSLRSHISMATPPLLPAWVAPVLDCSERPYQVVFIAPHQHMICHPRHLLYAT